MLISLAVTLGAAKGRSGCRFASILQQNGPGLEAIRQVLEPLMDESLLEPLPLDPFVHLFWAACLEAGIYIVSAADSAVAQKEMLGTLERLITGMWLSPRLD